MVRCEHCNKEHNGKFASGRFCCRSCANSRIQTTKINEKRSITLKNGKAFKRTGMRITEEHKKIISETNKKFQRGKYEKYILLWKEGKNGGMTKRGIVSGYIRRYMKIKYSNKCYKCGWNKVNVITGNSPIELHHIDGNSLNNKEENLEFLCPNCHSLTSTFKSLNKNSTRKYKIVYRTP